MRHACANFADKGRRSFDGSLGDPPFSWDSRYTLCHMREAFESGMMRRQHSDVEVGRHVADRYILRDGFKTRGRVTACGVNEEEIKRVGALFCPWQVLRKASPT